MTDVMKEIPLTQGQFAIVDDEDYERLTRHKWYAYWDGWNWYAKRGVWINGKMEVIYMHREIMNAPKGTLCDHINSNALDNRRENLRLCTHTQNMHNRKQPHKNNKLGIKGVCWHKKNKKYHAQIQVNGRRIYLGYFNVLDDADCAYRIAEEKYFYEFARKL